MQDIPSRDSHLLSIANQEEKVCPRQIKHSTSLAMVAGEGFEPSKALPADLQSAPIGRSGNQPGCYLQPANSSELHLLGSNRLFLRLGQER